MSDKLLLEGLSLKDIPELYSLKGKNKWARVISVYDGDTLNVVFFVGSELQQHKFRLYGIDTPEMRPLKSIENRAEIIEAAKKAKVYLESLVLDKVVFIRFREEEKYGRLMGEIYFDESTECKSVNHMMVENKFAKEYFGGSKN